MQITKLKYFLAYFVFISVLTILNVYYHVVNKGTKNGGFRNIIQPKIPQAVNSEKKRIFFLKTHKCASSTIQNILMRYGQKENLDFLLPSVKNYIGNPIHFNTKMAINNYSTADGQYDMFVHHTRYSKAVKLVMRQDTVFVTILRDPATLFQSIYTFYNFEKKYKLNLTEFITISLLNNTYFVEHVKRNKLGLNQLSWDLGLNSKYFNDEKIINQHIDIIERDFDFIMIFEYLEASLVLLADLMQWPLENMAHLPLNMRNNSYMQQLSEYDMYTLKKVSMADNILYNRFLIKFKEKIKAFGIDKLKTKIGKLIAINQEILDNCVESTKNHGYARTISYNVKNTKTICKYIAMNELEYTSLLRKIQYEKLFKFKTLDKLMNNY